VDVVVITSKQPEMICSKLENSVEKLSNMEMIIKCNSKLF
jgi:hypothetical protein